jgi:hypothetical protein
MGVPINNPASNRDGCPNISSACVIWQGPTIPCINLCSGDAIDEVVFKLATYLCELSKNIFDIENIDFACLVGEETIPPTNLEELIQLMITYSCNVSPTLFSAQSARIVGTSSTGEPILELPVDLCYYNEQGDYVSALPQSEYNVYIATKVATIITDINNYSDQFDYINQRLNNLQTNIDQIADSTNDIYVVSQCASSGTPGQQILIQDAFTTFERNYCNLTSVVGTTTSLYNGINTQISNLSNLPQLMDDRSQMRNLPRWVQNTSNVGDALSNLWLTISDIRSKVIEIANNTYSVPCILLSPENLQIGTIGMYSADIYWEKPLVTDVQPPRSYSIQVFATSDPEFTKPLYSATKSQIDNNPNTLNIASTSLDYNTDYVVHVSAIYQCGMSRPSTIISKLRQSEIFYKVVASSIQTTTPAVCTSVGETVSYTQEELQLYFDLKLKDAGTIITNNGIAPINIIARFQIDSCEYTEPVYDNVTFTIDIGESRSNTVTFISNKLTSCANGNCGSYQKYLLCGVFVSEPSTEFDPEYGTCN